MESEFGDIPFSFEEHKKEQYPSQDQDFDEDSMILPESNEDYDFEDNTPWPDQENALEHPLPTHSFPAPDKKAGNLFLDFVVEESPPEFEKF